MIALETRVKPHRSVACVFMGVLFVKAARFCWMNLWNASSRGHWGYWSPAPVVCLRVCAGEAENVPVSKTCVSPLSSDAFVDCHKRGDADETNQLLPALEETILQTARTNALLCKNCQGKVLTVPLRPRKGITRGALEADGCQWGSSPQQRKEAL